MQSFNQLQSFVFIDDLVEAIIKMALEPSENGHQSYFVNHPQPFDLESFWMKIGTLLDREVKVLKIPDTLFYLVAQTTSTIAPLFNRTPAVPLRLYHQMTKGHFIASPKQLELNLGWRADFDLDNTLKESYLRMQKKKMM